MAIDDAVTPRAAGFTEAEWLTARLDRLPPSVPIWRLVATLAMGGWFEIYGIFLTGYIGPGLVRAGTFKGSTEALFDLHGLGAFVASLFLGIFIGTSLVASVADTLGRRRVFVGALIGYAVASLAMSLQSAPYAILLCRILAGIGLGAELVTIDAYVAEIVPPRVRGRSFAFVQAMQFTSIPVLALLSWWLVPRAPLGVDGWRWVLWFGCLGAVVVWILRLRLPESPRWLIHKGRVDEAEWIVDSLERRIQASTGRELPPPRPIAAVAANPGVAAGGELWQPPYRKRTLTLLVFNFFQSIGYYGFANWIPTLLAGQGVGFAKSFLYSSVIALASPLGPLIGLVIADRMERKWLICGAACAVAIVGFLFAQQRAPVMLILFGLLTTLASNVMTFSYRTYQAELFSNRVRARAIGLVYSISRISAMFSGFLIAYVLHRAGTAGVFLVIAGAMGIVTIVISTFGPATRGRPLEELSP
jgi:putative MFS transporter